VPVGRDAQGDPQVVGEWKIANWASSARIAPSTPGRSPLNVDIGEGAQRDRHRQVRHVE